MFGAILAELEKNPDAYKKAPLRRCFSAGEALPEELGKRWKKAYGVELLDGLGSTEMLNNFICNRAGEMRYGTVGKPVSGYTAKLCDADGNEVPDALPECRRCSARFWRS